MANFARVWEIAALAEPSGGGVVSGSGTYLAGQTVTLTAVPNAGYEFVSWTENGVPVSTNAIEHFIVDADHAIVANFALIIPQMSIATATAGVLVLDWPADLPGWVLQESADLSAGSWANSTRTVTIVNGQCQVTVPSVERQRFFRLMHP